MIGNNSFYSYSSLKQAELHNITEIGEHSFYKCTSLKKIFINSLITTIGQYAFSDCMNLNEIEMQPSVSAIKCDTFRLFIIESNNNSFFCN